MSLRHAWLEDVIRPTAGRLYADVDLILHLDLYVQPGDILKIEAQPRRGLGWLERLLRRYLGGVAPSAELVKVERVDVATGRAWVLRGWGGTIHRRWLPGDRVTIVAVWR